MRRTVRDFLIILAITVGLFGPVMVWAADRADAAEGTYFFGDLAYPNPNRGDTTRNLLTIDTSTIAGQTCQVIVDTINGESVHAENYVTVEGGVPTITVTGTEDGVNGERQSASTVVMGDSLTIYNHFSYATSVAGDVIITCQDDTTTTTSSSSTTSSSTPTTTPETTTSTLPTSSTTSSIPVTSTTVPTGSTTTTSPSTTTSQPPGSTTSTTDHPSSTTSSIPPVTTVSTLPHTDESGDWDDEIQLGIAGAVLLVLGGAIVLAVREET